MFFRRTSLTSRKVSTFVLVSAIFGSRRKIFFSLICWTGQRLCSKLTLALEQVEHVFFKAESSLQRLTMEKALLAVFHVGFPRIRPTITEVALSAGRSRRGRCGIAREVGMSIKGGVKKEATRNSFALQSFQRQLPVYIFRNLF